MSRLTDHVSQLSPLGEAIDGSKPVRSADRKVPTFAAGPTSVTLEHACPRGGCDFRTDDREDLLRHLITHVRQMPAADPPGRGSEVTDADVDPATVGNPPPVQPDDADVAKAAARLARRGVHDERAARIIATAEVAVAKAKADPSMGPAAHELIRLRACAIAASALRDLRAQPRPASVRREPVLQAEPRVQCPQCGQHHVLRRDGTLRPHGPYTNGLGCGPRRCARVRYETPAAPPPLVFTYRYYWPWKDPRPLSWMYSEVEHEGATIGYVCPPDVSGTGWLAFGTDKTVRPGEYPTRMPAARALLENFAAASA
jgi:hypothetical protein